MTDKTETTQDMLARLAKETAPTGSEWQDAGKDEASFSVNDMINVLNNTHINKIVKPKSPQEAENTAKRINEAYDKILKKEEKREENRGRNIRVGLTSLMVTLIAPAIFAPNLYKAETYKNFFNKEQKTTTPKAETTAPSNAFENAASFVDSVNKAEGNPVASFMNELNAVKTSDTNSVAVPFKTEATRQDTGR